MPLFNVGKALTRSWTSGTWKAMLLKGTWTPDVEDRFVADLVAHEVAGGATNYVRKTLTGQAVVINDTDDRAEHDADTITWSNLIVPDFRFVVIYSEVLTDADHLLHSYHDVLQQAANAVDFVQRWNAGVLNGTVFRGTGV